MLSGSRVEDIHDRIVRAVRDFFAQAGMSRAVLGLSGGIDSAVVASIAAEALGKDHVTGILMPSSWSTVHSVNDAVELADNLGIKYHIIPIGAVYLSMGYGTLYGDLCGSLMVIADLYKTEVYELAAYINREKELIPLSTITKAPSAELRDGQKDTDSLPPYDVLDPVLYSLNEGGRSAEQILQEGVDKALVERILRLRKAAAFKVHQLAPEITVSSCPLLDRSKWVEPKTM